MALERPSGEGRSCSSVYDRSSRQGDATLLVWRSLEAGPPDKDGIYSAEDTQIG